MSTPKPKAHINVLDFLAETITPGYIKSRLAFYIELLVSQSFYEGQRQLNEDLQSTRDLLTAVAPDHGKKLSKCLEDFTLQHFVLLSASGPATDREANQKKLMEIFSSFNKDYESWYWKNRKEIHSILRNNILESSIQSVASADKGDAKSTKDVAQPSPVMPSGGVKPASGKSEDEEPDAAPPAPGKKGSAPKT